jgi:predicted nucleotidyltransferase
MAPMKTSLDHLPPRRRLDLERMLKILFSEFQDAISRRTQPHRRNGRILKVILYGSFARGDWVDDRSTGYKSDYDILVVVDHEDLTDMIEYWSRFEQRLLQDYMFTQQIRFPVALIVHSFVDVNDQLRRGRPFFIDAMRDGIALYEAPGPPFDGPQPLTPAEALAEAQGYFDEWFPRSESGMKGFRFYVAEDELKDAAFMLHQTTERLYHCVLLVLQLYSPQSHNIKFLRSRAEALDTRFVPAWPRKTRIDRRQFDLLRRAYVEARYSKHYLITAEELAWLGERVTVLRDLVETVCRAHLAAMRGA